MAVSAASPMLKSRTCEPRAYIGSKLAGALFIDIERDYKKLERIDASRFRKRPSTSAHKWRPARMTCRSSTSITQLNPNRLETWSHARHAHTRLRLDFERVSDAIACTCTKFDRL